MPTQVPDILCFGEPMVEFVRVGDPDSDVYHAGIGGDTSNAAISAARQGARVGYMTALGQDKFADRILAVLGREGVDCSLVRRNPDAPTGMYIIDPDPAERHFTYFRSGSAASLYGPQDLPGDGLVQAKVLHVSGITLAVSESLRSSALHAMQRMQAAGQCVSFDTNLRLKLWSVETARDATRKAAALATVIITSVEDSEILTGLTEPDEILAHYTGLGAKIVVLTLGAEGALIATDAQTHRIDPAPATPVDSTGAGDSFAGAFLAWWLETKDAVKAARLAAIVAAGTVSGLGAVDPIPRREMVLETATGLGVAV